MKRPALMWNDDTKEWDERPRNVEEQVDLRRRRKRLVDVELPEGFRLVTREPKQFWMDHQMRWGFMLAWGRVGKGDEYSHVGRYESMVSDEIQMEWALADFTRELDNAGVRQSDRQPWQEVAGKHLHPAHLAVHLKIRAVRTSSFPKAGMRVA